MPELSTIQPITLRQQIVEQVRRAIIDGALKPGDHITELALTRQLGVSRTPVREALILLESEGLVVSTPNRGSFVRAFDEDDVDEIFSMRTALENMAADLLIDKLTDRDFQKIKRMIEDISHAITDQALIDARRIDMHLHQYLIERTNHSILIKNWSQLVAQIAALLHIRNNTFPEYPELAMSEDDHMIILNAYQARDLAAVQQANRSINERVAGECKRALAVGIVDSPAD